MQDKITYLKSFTEQLEAQLEKEKGKYLKLKELLEDQNEVVMKAEGALKHHRDVVQYLDTPTEAPAQQTEEGVATSGPSEEQHN